MRQLSHLDKMIQQTQQILARKFSTKLDNMSNETFTRSNPALTTQEAELSPSEIKHTISLMRINHAGEMAAQGLYQGQALTAKQEKIQEHMQQAANEEAEHLQWCYERLQELGGRASYLDPLWYYGSVLIGALAGIAGDKWSLGFIAETENQVSAHLEKHLQLLPAQDRKSHKILTQMQQDEQQHEHQARNAGGAALPLPIQWLMRLTSKIMVTTAYYI